MYNNSYHELPRAYQTSIFKKLPLDVKLNVLTFLNNFVVKNGNYLIINKINILKYQNVNNLLQLKYANIDKWKYYFLSLKSSDHDRIELNNILSYKIINWKKTRINTIIKIEPLFHLFNYLVIFSLSLCILINRITIGNKTQSIVVKIIVCVINFFCLFILFNMNPKNYICMIPTIDVLINVESTKNYSKVLFNGKNYWKVI